MNQRTVHAPNRKVNQITKKDRVTYKLLKTLCTSEAEVSVI
jgi:hypothetical protein